MSAGPDDHKHTTSETSHSQDSLLNNTPLYHQCRPLIWMMRLGGMFFVHPTSVNMAGKVQPVTGNLTEVINDMSVEQKGRKFRLWRTLEELSRVWCVLVFLILVGYSAKSLYSTVFGLRKLRFVVSDLGAIFIHITYAMWVLQLLIIQFLFVRGCFAFHDAGMFKFFISWNRLRFSCAFGTCPNFSHIFRTRRSVIVCIAFVHLTAQIISITGPFFIPGPAYAQLNMQLMEGFGSYDTALHILNYSGGILSSVVYIAPCYYFLLIAQALTIEFGHLTRDLAKAIEEPSAEGKSTSLQTLEWFRIRHVSMCELVELAEDVFSPWIFLVLGGSIIQLLLSVFVAFALGWSWTYITTLSQLFWFLTYSVQTLVVLYAGSRLHETAHGVLPYIYKIDQSRLSLSEGLQIQTFLNKLTCNRIGFTAWRMFTITNEAVLGLIAAYITHQILVFQLQLDLGLDAKVESCGELMEHNRYRENVTRSSMETAANATILHH